MEFTCLGFVHASDVSDIGRTDDCFKPSHAVKTTD